MTRADMMGRDSIGLPKFDEQRAKAMVDMVRNKGLLISDPPKCSGSGIVIAGGGPYLDWAWVCVRRLRQIGCQLPIQVWHLGPKEMPEWAKPLYHKYGVETVDAFAVMRSKPTRLMSGWLLKNYAVINSPWQNVVFIDADCMPSLPPEELINEAEVRKHGSIFFSDVGFHHKNSWGYVFAGIKKGETEWETGQFLVDKIRGWMGLRWTEWINEHSDVWGKFGYGDKFFFELGFRIAGSPHLLSRESKWGGFGISQGWAGREFFQHSMAIKRGEWPKPVWMSDFFEEWRSCSPGIPARAVA